MKLRFLHLMLGAALVPGVALAVNNNAYTDVVGPAGGATTHTVFSSSLNGTASDPTGQATEMVSWGPVTSVSWSMQSQVPSGSASGYADLSFSFVVDGPRSAGLVATSIPIDISGNYVFQGQSNNAGYDGANLLQVGGVGGYSFLASQGGGNCPNNFCSGSYSGQATFTPSGSSPGPLSGTVDLLANIGATTVCSGTNCTPFRSFASINSYIQIDPTWAAANPGYTLVVEAGIGNAPTAAVPETGSPVMMLLGLAVLIGLKRARRSRIAGKRFVIG